MAEALKGLFFTDRLRSIVSTAALLLILAALVGQWMWPKKVELDSQSFKLIHDVAEKMERAAVLYEKQGASTTALNETMKKQLALQEYNRSLNYGELYKRYGMDLPPPPGVVPIGDDGLPIVDFGVLPPDDDFGSQYPSTGAGVADRNHQLQEPAAGGKEKPVQRSSATPGDVPHTPRE